MLTNLVRNDNKICIQSLNTKVAIGYKRQDIVWDSLIILRTSTSDIKLNLSKEGGTVLGDRDGNEES